MEIGNIIRGAYAVNKSSRLGNFLVCLYFTLSVGLDSVLKHYETQLQKEKGSYAGLTDTQRRNAEDALLDGDLLEVTTDESTQLWQVISLYLHHKTSVFVY